MAKCKESALKCAYSAVMQANFVIGKFSLMGEDYALKLKRAEEITSEALTHLNSEHTKEIQKAVFNFK